MLLSDESLFTKSINYSELCASVLTVWNNYVIAWHLYRLVLNLGRACQKLSQFENTVSASLYYTSIRKILQFYTE